MESKGITGIGRAALFYGGLWGLIEATLGYLLHLWGRFSPVPGLAGFVLFPVAFLLLYRAYRASGRAAAVPAAAVVAAAAKAASALVPGIGLEFTTNPVLAILAEGAVVFLGLRLFVFRPGRLLPVGLLAVSLGWRLLFLGLVALLPVQKGILMKGPDALLGFLLIEPAVNTLLLSTLAWLRLPSSWWETVERLSRRRLPAALAAVAGLGAQLLFASL
jgi:hypothetical protein